MAERSNEHRLTVVETTLRENNITIFNGLSEIRQMLKESGEQRVQIISQLATVIEKQTSFATYQSKCDDERKKFGGRLFIVETFQRNQIKIAGCISGSIALLITNGKDWWETFKGWVS